jgi:hypothetical protein
MSPFRSTRNTSRRSHPESQLPVAVARSGLTEDCRLEPRRYENPQGGQRIFTQGQHFSGTGFELVEPITGPDSGIIVVNPNLDAVTEAKVSLQNYDAEFGKAVASVVTAQTKSGSNEFHGSAFWYRRTDALQARDPFAQSTKDSVTGRFIPNSRWQQFGGTVGGPIIKDKLFVFGDYQGTRQSNGVSGLFTVPTQTVINSCDPVGNPGGTCDLSQYLTAGVTGGGQAFDPNTGDPLKGTGRSAFPNNQIPNSRISPAAATILKLFPKGQLNPDGSEKVLNNFVGAGSGPFTQNSFDVRVDYAATQSLSVFGRYSLSHYSLSGQGLWAKSGTGQWLPDCREAR